jgi:PRC-barrel domain
MRAVIGTRVKDAAGERIGEIADLLLDERFRKILFAIVIRPGGETHPVPWSSLRYDETEDVYVVASAEEVESEPAVPIDEFDLDGPDSGKRGYWATV